jgi:hypothetical protein
MVYRDHPCGDPVPEGIEDMEPGPILAAFLSAIDVHSLSGYGRILILQAHQRLASHYAAAVYDDMTAVKDVLVEEDGEDFAAESAAAEIRAALHLTRRCADAELSFALEMRQRLPNVFDALASGVIDVRRAKVFDRALLDLPIATARTIADHVLAEAPGLTTGQIGARLERLRMQTAPEQAKQRYEQAVDERHVFVEPTPAGTANLYAYDLPPDRASALMRRINTMARSLRVGGEARSVDQLRTDVFLDLTEGGTNRSDRRGVVDITVDLETLTQLNDHPGELAGYGPVIADIARQTAEAQTDAKWVYTTTDPDTGQPIATGTTKRRPSAAQRRAVIARNPNCVFPGCRMPAIDCDLDHRTPWNETHTTKTSDLAPGCRFDHITRHKAHWTYTIEDNGDITWTSRLGHTYTVKARLALPP